MENTSAIWPLICTKYHNWIWCSKLWEGQKIRRARSFPHLYTPWARQRWFENLEGISAISPVRGSKHFLHSPPLLREGSDKQDWGVSPAYPTSGRAWMNSPLLRFETTVWSLTPTPRQKLRRRTHDLISRSQDQSSSRNSMFLVLIHCSLELMDLSATQLRFPWTECSHI